MLTDLGIDTYLPTDEPIDLLREALDEELDAGQDQPTLYDTYNAATRALTHADGITADQRDQGLEQAAQLLDRHGDVPDATTLGEQAVAQRANASTTEDEVEPYWDGEKGALPTLLQAHGDAA